MGRGHFIVSSENFYHITARCINKEWFRVPLNDVWQIMEHQLFFLKHGFDIEIMSFVLMNNHIHLIARSPKANLSEAMSYFMREVSRSITFQSGRINQTWGGRYHRCLLDSCHYFLNAYKYVYYNPVHAKKCKTAEEYPYSTLALKLGKRHSIIPVIEDTILFEGNILENLAWINKTPSSEYIEYVRRALRRKSFKLTKVSNRKNPLEVNLL